MSEKILCVDDEPNILTAFQRQLRGRFRINTAPSGEQGLVTISNQGPYAVVVSDLRMPGMDGITFLASVREFAPESVRIMLTGHADLTVAIEAVNEGNIFRFLTKPCPPEVLAKALSAGIEQYRLVRAEKELLEKTLSGSVKILTDVLALANPTAFGRASRVQRLVSKITKELGVKSVWQINVASMLSQVGCITLLEDTLERIYRGIDLSQKELQMYRDHPLVGRDLIANIPRLEGIAEIIAYQEKRFDGSGFPSDDKQGREIPPGARILKIALDFDTFVTSGMSNEEALAEVDGREGWYDPDVLAALQRVLSIEIKYDIKSVNLDELIPNMILAEDFRGTTGVLLLAAGQEVTPSLCIRMQNYARIAGVKKRIKVKVYIDAD